MPFPVSFYLGKRFLPDVTWEKIWKERKKFPLKVPLANLPFHSWIYQTWLLLTEAGIECKLCTEIPQEGILIALNLSLDRSFGTHPPLPEDVFFVDIVTQLRTHPAAHFHLVQNKVHAQWLPHSQFVPHWPQPHLLPRDVARENRFENICFFGQLSQCAEELQTAEWAQQVRHQLGAYVDVRRTDRWHYYSDADVVVAIRDFSRSRHFQKPATKLYNAWLAGVPFIGGRDAAYAAEGCPGKNYLVATSPKELLTHLKRLREEESFRQELIHHGFLAAATISQEATFGLWKKLVQETLPSLAAQWQQQSAKKRSSFLKKQRLIHRVNQFFCSYQ